MRPSRTPHLIRGFAGASLATFVALASHVWVGGGMPGMLGVAVPWMLSVAACTLLAGRRLSLVRLSISVLLSQALFHALFVLGTIAPRATLGAHAHGVLPTLPLSGAGALVPEDAGMWLAHAVAALCTVAVLYRGEQVLQALARLAGALRAWVRRVVARPVRVPAAPTARARWVRVVAPTRRDPRFASLSRRGPPLRLI